MNGTVEELLAGMRAAGERVPNRFIRAGLLYDLNRDYDLGVFYTYEPCEGFEVDGVYYSLSSRSPGLMTYLINEVTRPRMQGPRMNHSQPPTEEELDRWMRTPGAPSYIHEDNPR